MVAVSGRRPLHSEMKFIFLFALFFITLISGTYLLVEVEDVTDKTKDSEEPQCTGKSVSSPWDICNNCTCTDDGCVSKKCTTTRLLGLITAPCPGKKKPGQLCSLKLKNCVFGQVCANIFESCNNDVGKCLDEGETNE